MAKPKRSEWQWEQISSRFPTPSDVSEQTFSEFVTEQGIVALMRGVTEQELRRYPQLLEREPFEVWENECRRLLWQIVCSPTWRAKALRLHSLPDALYALFHEWARAEADRIHNGPSSEARRRRAGAALRGRMTLELGREPSEDEVVAAFNARKRDALVSAGRNPDRDSSVYLRPSDLRPCADIPLDTVEGMLPASSTEDPAWEASELIDEVLEGLDSQLLREITQQWLAPLFRRQASDPASTGSLAESFGLSEDSIEKVLNTVRPRFAAAIEAHGWLLPEVAPI